MRDSTEWEMFTSPIAVRQLKFLDITNCDDGAREGLQFYNSACGWPKTFARDLREFHQRVPRSIASCQGPGVRCKSDELFLVEPQGYRMTSTSVWGKYNTKAYRRRIGELDEDGEEYDSDEFDHYDLFASPDERVSGKEMETTPVHPRADGKAPSKKNDNVVTKCAAELFALIVRLQSQKRSDGSVHNRLFFDCAEPLPVLVEDGVMPLARDVCAGESALSHSFWKPPEEIEAEFEDQFRHTITIRCAESREERRERGGCREDETASVPADPSFGPGPGPGPALGSDTERVPLCSGPDKALADFQASLGRFASGRSFRYCLSLGDIVAARLHVPVRQGKSKSKVEDREDTRDWEACLVLQVTPLASQTLGKKVPFAMRRICSSPTERAFQPCQDWTPHQSASSAHQVVFYGSVYELVELCALMIKREPRLSPLFDAGLTDAPQLAQMVLPLSAVFQAGRDILKASNLPPLPPAPPRDETLPAANHWDGHALSHSGQRVPHLCKPAFDPVSARIKELVQGVMNGPYAETLQAMIEASQAKAEADAEEDEDEVMPDMVDVIKNVLNDPDFLRMFREHAEDMSDPTKNREGPR